VNFQQLYTVILTHKAAISCMRNTYWCFYHDEWHAPLADTVILFIAVHCMAQAGPEVYWRYITAFVQHTLSHSNPLYALKHYFSNINLISFHLCLHPLRCVYHWASLTKLWKFLVSPYISSPFYHSWRNYSSDIMWRAKMNFLIMYAFLTYKNCPLHLISNSFSFL
jgi:hypothetical protein